MNIRSMMTCTLVCTSIVILAAPLTAQANIPLTFEAQVRCYADAGEQGDSLDEGLNIASAHAFGAGPGGSISYACSIACTSTTQGAEIAMAASYSMSGPSGGGGCGYSGSHEFSIQDGGLWIGTTQSTPEGTPLSMLVQINNSQLLSSSYHFELLRDEELLGSWSNSGPATWEIPVYAGEQIQVRSLFTNYSYNGNANIVFQVAPEPATALLLLAGLPLIRRR